MRRVPPTILIALALMGVRALSSVVLIVSSDGRPWFPAWYLAITTGLSFTVMPLLVAGMLELRQRVAALGFVLVIALVVAQTWFLQRDMALKPAVREAYNYAVLGAHLVAMGALASAVWTRRPVLAIGAIGAAILSVPPPALAKIFFSTVDSYRGFSAIQVGLHIPQLVVLLLLSLELARDPEPRPVIAADGLRHATRALCLFSLAAALAGIRVLYQPFIVTALGSAALAYAAFGLLRAARSPVDRWLVSGAATAMLWCLSLQVSELPDLYGREFMPEQSPMMFVMLVAAATFVTLATKGTVDKMQLQAKGIGAIMMFVTALAIAMFLVPQSQSMRSMNALNVLTGFVVALGAWMLSWLCKLAAERIESSDTSLPAARVV
jgi:hypothetical protein